MSKQIPCNYCASKLERLVLGRAQSWRKLWDL